MAKFKLNKYKFIFYPRRYAGASNWKDPSPVDYHFGNKRTDKLNQYQYSKSDMGSFFSDQLKDDERRWSSKAKFSESEATILLLQYLEDKLKSARKEKKRLDLMEKKKSFEFGHERNMMIHLDYARTVNNRELAHLVPACKLYRKKVKELKKSPEYLWEQLLK